jgi:hypothetical protein
MEDREGQHGGESSSVDIHGGWRFWIGTWRKGPRELNFWFWEYRTVGSALHYIKNPPWQDVHGRCVYIKYDTCQY